VKVWRQPPLSDMEIKMRCHLWWWVSAAVWLASVIVLAVGWFIAF